MDGRSAGDCGAPVVVSATIPHDALLAGGAPGYSHALS